MSTLDGSVKSIQFERLPTTVVPLVYEIVIKPDLVNFTFTGSESVSIHIAKSVDQIILNADDLIIETAAYAAKNSGYCSLANVILDRDNQRAIIKFAEILQSGHGTLYMSFRGNLNDQTKGFYRCKYEAANGEERYSASTQFGTTYARRAFPCWDEPAIKARFQITIIAPKNLVVLSNTNVISDEPYEEDRNLKVVKFGQTPIMSTYLVAFVIGEYEYIETRTDRGTCVRVFTPIGKSDQGKFALEIAGKSLTLLENYFNIPYPLEKLDHIAVPEFAHGGMENWGLVTYRECCLLENLGEEFPSIFTRESEEIAFTVCHETAHQWIGNLVTMEWWTNFRIYEGLANFMEYFALDSIYPELELWSEFVHFECFFAFDLDSSYNSQPFEVSIERPSEVNEFLDLQCYHKGASIIRMCYKWIGSENFREGLHSFLIKHTYKTATSEDLWRALEEASKMPVVKTMLTWTKQPGFPIVHVSTRTEGNRRILVLTQERFIADKLLDEEDEQLLWHIPIAFVTSRNPEKVIVSTLMETKTIKIHLDDLEPNDWVKINPQVTGFYLVKYSSDMLESLKPAIQGKQIGPIDRCQILNDLSACFRAGKAALVDLLELISFYNHEDKFFIWEAINNIVDELILSLRDDQSQALLSSVGLELYAKLYEKLGFDSLPNEKPNQESLRTSVLEKLIEFGDENVISEAKKRYADHFNGNLIAPAMENVFRAIKRHLDKIMD